MTIARTIYGLADGEYRRFIMAPDWDNIGLNMMPGEITVEGIYPEDSYLQSGHVVLMPPRPPGPVPWHFDRDTGAWIDPRTPADLQAALYAAREATMRDKSDLLMTLVQMRLMEAADARVAARGDIPAVYQDAFNQLPQEAQDYAMIKWPSDQVISRMNPIALLFAFVAQIDDDQLDAAFGVQRPE